MSDKIKIDEFTIENINKDFNIPIYQRPYAWTTKEVEVLLMDFFNAYNNEKDYYIGNIVTYPNNDKLDIVDGQQRWTTLFLIGIIAGWEKNINLDYEIREKDREFLEEIQNKFDEKKQYQDINNNLIENLRFIKSFFDDKKDDDFKKWISTNVKFVLTELNENIDVNKYFEVMNNRGIQLEKHHILKANLLSKIDKEEQKIYAKVWDYCSDMNVYLEEYILKDEENEEKIKDIRKGLLSKPLKQFTGNDSEEKTLFEILGEDKVKIDTEANKEINSTKEIYKSIISFESFLLHIYKITIDDTITINDSDLLEIIKIDNSKNAKEFIEAILEYRVLFDYFVFKRDKEQKAYLKTIDIDNEGTIKTDNNLLMIELLFEITSSKFNLWLTDFLKQVKTQKDTNSLVEFLETKDKKEAKKRKADKEFEELLNQGTSTPHYWFYKLEYLLWKDDVWKDIKILKSYNINNYRLKHLSSIEHIQPQHPQAECKEWGDCNIDNFGNLALISKNMNSKLSNQCFKNKRADIEKQISNGRVESLKMLLIYSKYNDWNSDNCKEHYDEMINIL